MRTTMMMVGAAVTMGLASPLGAQMAAPAPCATPAPPPPAFAGWEKRAPLADGGTIAIGQSAALALVSAPRFAIAPGHAPATGTFGASLRFTVATAGTYRVAVGSAVWIDVVQAGVSLTSTAHDRGPACSPVRKIVDFRLAPGVYALQVSGSATPSVGVMIVRAS